MSIIEARKHLEKFHRENDILEFDESSATVLLAAEVLNVEPGRIAKSISLKNGEGAILVVTAGDTKVDNKKFKAEFGMKAKMLTPEETMKYIGHPVGGVCPFGLKKDVPIFLDESLKRFETVYPACGSSNSAIKLTCSELEEYSESQKWVDVCKNME
ncbi:MAG: YbaK/EbsC family protein [Bacillota bacterium]|nr:YbaK/EbsC family protein [Bacillota bacterium]